jgi:anti-sigma regulatory factor (Ser/Thr protein kinase)
LKDTKKEIVVSAETSSLADVRAFVEKSVREAGFTGRDSRLVVLAIDEAITNIIHYAASHNARDTLTVSINVDDVRLKVTIDEGLNTFDTPSMPNGEMEEYIRKEGAYSIGIFLIRRIMDEISYQFKKGFENSLTMIKYR